MTRCSEKDIGTQNAIRAITSVPYIWMQPAHQTQKEQTSITLCTIQWRFGSKELLADGV